MIVRQAPAPSTSGPSVVEIVIGGELNADAVPDIRAAMRGVLAGRPGSIVVDLAECAFIDAAGVAFLLELHRCVWLSDGRIALRSPAPQVRTVLRNVRVEHILQVERVSPRQIRPRPTRTDRDDMGRPPCRPR